MRRQKKSLMNKSPNVPAERNANCKLATYETSRWDDFDQVKNKAKTPFIIRGNFVLPQAQ
ncbi:hypothetical protein CA265_20065 [Sphingobacteriaceae bacterium GW460-11-11-14-LB5]|nr:hypothetical protein CA265_20065 [Sphingobacteriaceae bacterium GW460-11-11-14-LB5]